MLNRYFFNVLPSKSMIVVDLNKLFGIIIYLENKETFCYNLTYNERFVSTSNV